MNMHKTMMWGALGLGALGMTACYRQDPVAAQPQAQQPYAQQPPQQQPMVDQQPQYVIVQQAPPPIVVERRPAAPSVDVVWIDGYWNWSNQSYNWNVGHYERPPQPNVVWIAPRYEADPRGGHFTPGRWSPGGGDGRRGRN